MSRRAAVWVIAMVLVSLALTALVPSWFGGRGSTPGAGSPPRSSEATASWTGLLPSAFSLDGSLSGQESEPGFQLPDGTPLKVSGARVSAQAKREVDRMSGVERLTGRESFRVSGTLDRKTDRLTGTVVWTLTARRGERFFDWRFDGTLDARFTGSTSAKGTLSGTTTLVERYGSPAAAPTTTRGRASWTYTALRGR